MAKAIDFSSMQEFDYNEFEYIADIEKLEKAVLVAMPVLELDKQDLTDIHDRILELCSYAESHRYMCEQFCSNYRYDSPIYYKRFEKLERTIERLCTYLNCELITQNDPRGATVKLKLSTGKTNDWTNEGYIVPIKYWYAE